MQIRKLLLDVIGSEKKQEKNGIIIFEINNNYSVWNSCNVLPYTRPYTLKHTNKNTHTHSHTQKNKYMLLNAYRG